MTIPFSIFNSIPSKPKIFVSYSSKDKEFVEKLSIDLTSVDLDIWIDTEEIKGGDSIIHKISNGLSECNYYCIILSEHSTESSWVERELEIYTVREIEEKTKVIPLLIEDCHIPTILKAKRYIDFRSSYNNGLIQLLDSIHEDLSNNQNVTALPSIKIDKKLSQDLFDNLNKKDESRLNFTKIETKAIMVRVAFKSTGELFKTNLPGNISCREAARKIIGEVFLNELPIQRRDVFLSQGSFSMLCNGEEFTIKTVNEAKIQEGDLIYITNTVPVMRVMFSINGWKLQEQRRIERQNPINRIFGYISNILYKRLDKIGLKLYS